jgi:HlyD family secretion protein
MNSTDERGEDIGMDRKRKTRKKRWIIGGTIAVVLTVLVSLYAMRSKETAYKTVKAEIGDITTYYAFSGNVAAKNRQMLLSEQMMQIAEILVEKGDRVKTGDVLIKTTAGEELKAGIDGEVTKIYKEENEQIMPGEQLVEIVDYDHLEIVFRADEYDVDALEPGKDAVAEISAIGKVIRGTINDVSREGQIVNGREFDS